MDIWNMRECVTFDTEIIRERYESAMERTREIEKETAERKETKMRYFHDLALFLLKIDALCRSIADDSFYQMNSAEAAAYNRSLFEEILPENYETSFANPQYAVRELGEDGRLLSFVFAEMIGLIRYATDCRMENVTIYTELFLELYGISCDEYVKPSELSEIVYWFMSDYADVLLPQRVRGQFLTDEEWIVKRIREADFSDPEAGYLYRMGEYVSEDEVNMACFLNSLPEEQIDNMARNFVEGYARGFVNAGLELSRKKTVEIRYSLGMEKLICRALPMFEKMGLEVTILSDAVSALTRRPGRKTGLSSVGANPQFDYDHRFDCAMFLDKKFKERKLEVMRNAYEELGERAALFAGPILVEGFGAPHTVPVKKEESYSFRETQEKLFASMNGEMQILADSFVHEDTTSFCIVSYPVPAIGEHFEEIFYETYRLNTLDHREYMKIQQAMIDALDAGTKVHVLGKKEAGNRTDITVSLCDIKDPANETRFENCLADVNIPLGEVFTSPKLAGTDGVLFVSEVYLHGLLYKNLEVVFENGMVKEYRLENFDSEEKNRNYFKENVLMNHETLPLGEFAIGTNTTAYAMAKKYNIFDRLDILIAEKTGPHFALGDTCYSFAEENRVYNPDGKEIMAKENEISARRYENPSESYFNCHTDITIPYDELERIEVLDDEGNVMTILVDGGKFVLPGTEPLNIPLNDCK